MAYDINLIALCSLPLIGPVSIRRLIRAFGSAEGVFKAAPGQLLQVEGISDKRAGEIRDFRGWDELERNIERVKGEGAGVITEDSGEYPDALRELGKDAPLVLYIKGRVIKDDRFAIAIVGSRSASPYGKTITERISSDLSSMGFTVVSGLARGIDASAHKGCLEAGGRSLGVLGSGIDVVYPRENERLFSESAASGAVMTEFPPGMPPLPLNFPRRNRILSGLALGALVVEAAEKSGSLITARFALEQGKEVFSIPGNINSFTSQGTNKLIKQGAKVVTGAADIVEELAPQLKGFIKCRRKAEVTTEEQALCDIISAEPCHIDLITRQSGLPPAKTLAVLLGLELKGIVKQMEGKRFYLA